MQDNVQIYGITKYGITMYNLKYVFQIDHLNQGKFKKYSNMFPL